MQTETKNWCCFVLDVKEMKGLEHFDLVWITVEQLKDRTLEKAFLDSGELDLGLVSARSNSIEP